MVFDSRACVVCSSAVGQPLGPPALQGSKGQRQVIVSLRSSLRKAAINVLQDDSQGVIDSSQFYAVYTPGCKSNRLAQPLLTL